MSSTDFMQSDRVALSSRFCIDLLSELSLPIPLQRHCAHSLNAFTPRFSLRPLWHSMAGSSHFYAQVCVRSNMQMDCPECAMLQACLALVGRQAAQYAAPPGHRRRVPLGRGKVQGKIKGRGTSLRENPVCTWGWRGTRLIAAPCREIGQCLVGIGERACFARWTVPVLDGGMA
ncbi:hypothetical protein GN109_12525 [Collimonas pratensis]|uniref:hypothetical protein n=1 Tax=Collimonas pratensis TaxID=279113 RepID=UPI00143D4D60|nr:hypothetical protein [Collimonas pratensis]NKI70244.1 hypothetical protein [Collimonas pratensis]